MYTARWEAEIERARDGEPVLMFENANSTFGPTTVETGDGSSVELDPEALFFRQSTHEAVSELNEEWERAYQASPRPGIDAFNTLTMWGALPGGAAQTRVVETPQGKLARLPSTAGTAKKAYRIGERMPSGRRAGMGPGAASVDDPAFKSVNTGANNTPAESSASANIKINLEHVFHGEINRHGKAVGFHHQGSIGADGHARIAPGTAAPPDQLGVYKANVQLFNAATGGWVDKGVPSTFFPDAWSRAQVIREIRAAYEGSLRVGANGWEGVSPSGVTIRGYLDANGNINTAFPIMKAP